MKKSLAITTILITLFLCACTPVSEVQQTPTPQLNQEQNAPTATPNTTQDAVNNSATPYLTADPTPEAIEPKQMYITGSVVNVRKEANASSTVLTTLKRNTTVTAYQQENGWYYIEYAENKFGYMSAQYLSDEKYIATAEEQLELMSEFDFYKNMPVEGLAPYEEAAFAVTDLNQNGRLELIVFVTDNVTVVYGDISNANVFEIDENYAELKKYESLKDVDNYYIDNEWPFLIYGIEAYFKDNKYYYRFGDGGINRPDEMLDFICFDDYKTTRILLGRAHTSREIDEEAEDYIYQTVYYDSKDKEITKEEYEAIKKNPFSGAVKKEFSIGWEYIQTRDRNEKPLYDYSKATPAQKLVALKKSYEGFKIK